MPNKSDIQTEINFLAALEAGKVTSQMRLSQRIGVSVGLINALIKRAILKGYVKARSAPAKRYAYYLTPKGFSEKSRLVADYLETSLDFFRMARAEYGDIFERLRHCGDNRIILGGRGELTEIALLAAREQGLEPTAVFDSSSDILIKALKKIFDNRPDILKNKRFEFIGPIEKNILKSTDTSKLIFLSTEY
jgi:DNA-binding MarR family transcriptional regulator